MKNLLFLTILATAFPAFSAPSQQERPRVLVEEIKLFDDKKRIIVPVKVEAKIQSLVSSDIEGHITRILKPLGSSVRAGEVVLYLENKDPGFTYAAVPVRSPVAGVVSQYWTSQMAKVTRGDKLFTVINPKSLRLSAEFPSGDLSVIRSGLEGVFRTEAQGDLNLPIRIVGISPLVDSRTGTASAELEFTKAQNLPAIGSIGQATFEVDQGQILMIPETSLIYQNGKPMVRILQGANKVLKKLIELGEQRESSFVVKSGLGRGDKVIVRSSRPIKEGDLIEIENQPEEKVQ